MLVGHCKQLGQLMLNVEECLRLQGKVRDKDQWCESRARESKRWFNVNLISVRSAGTGDLKHIEHATQRITCLHAKAWEALYRCSEPFISLTIGYKLSLLMFRGKVTLCNWTCMRLVPRNSCSMLSSLSSADSSLPGTFIIYADMNTHWIHAGRISSILWASHVHPVTRHRSYSVSYLCCQWVELPWFMLPVIWVAHWFYLIPRNSCSVLSFISLLGGTFMIYTDSDMSTRWIHIRFYLTGYMVHPVTTHSL